MGDEVSCKRLIGVHAGHIDTLKSRESRPERIAPAADAIRNGRSKTQADAPKASRPRAVRCHREPMSEPLVRPAVLDDAEAISVVHHTSWMQTYSDLLPAEHWVAMEPSSGSVGSREWGAVADAERLWR